ncbi:MAG: endonuclease domain-containing protein [Novosphingobium sp.]
MPRPKMRGNLTKAKHLRASQTLPEALLWRLLKGSPGGVHFRRQHAVGPYVLDFYCARAKIGIEVDGIAHDMGNRPERDAARDAWLDAHGITILRIAASDVLQSPEDIAEGILRSCGG